MNFLAHLYLSGKNPDIILGNFIADMVKGRNIYRYKPSVVEGISLHRLIDEFTDKHKIVAKSKKRLRGKYGHFSPVIVDMFYDHFLAKNWQCYSDMSINEFLSNSYNILIINFFVLPPKAQKILPFMIANNWLGKYAEIKSLQRNFEGMAKRTKFNSKMEFATADLIEGYDSYYEDFMEFFPEIIKYVESQR